MTLSEEDRQTILDIMKRLFRQPNAIEAVTVVRYKEGLAILHVGKEVLSKEVTKERAVQLLANGMVAQIVQDPSTVNQAFTIMAKKPEGPLNN
ncbi:MAG TPA: hypothetical protein VMU05_00420 [Dongiaceae bacterium]|nr:hypothetical protein [Dongiaceae bacterium]